MPAKRTTVDLTDKILTPTQWAFLSDHTARVKALLGGLGSGKTATGAEAFIDLVLANPGCQLMMAGPTHEMTRDLCVPAFEAACPPGLITRYIKSEKLYRLRGGRTVKHGSADKPSSLEGRNLAGFWADEARYWPSASWRNILARLRDKAARRLQGIVTSTPAAGWLEEEFDRDDPDRKAYSISTRENERNLGPGYIDNLLRSYSKRLAESLVEGRFGVIAGQVYEEFDESVHVVEWEYDPRYPLWLSWDFGVRAASILFAQPTGDFHVETPDGRTLPPKSVVVFDEIQPEEIPTDKQIPKVILKLKALAEKHGASEWIRPDRIVCDPAGRQRSQDTGTRNVTLLREAFGEVVRYETDMNQRHIPDRIARVGGALEPVEGEPTLYVAKSLVGGHHRGVVKSLRGSTYPEKDGRRTSDMPKEDKYEHARDTLEYLVVRAQNETRHPAREGRASIAYGRR